MGTDVNAAADPEVGRRDALADRLFQSMIATAELASVWLGLRLDLYELLREHGPATMAELAGRAGIDTRYAREWLEQQAVAGFLDVEPSGDAGPGQAAAEDWETRRYRLPDPHADVLLDADHPAHAGAAAYWVGSLAEVLQRLPGLYRSGAGLPYPEYGADVRLAIANFNRPMFVNDLAGWFAATPELQARLAADGARVLDAGCGIGWSSISLARAFPSLRVDGIDADEASIAEARRLADEAGVADRVRFEVADAAELGAAGGGGYDAAFVFEALHDMARPVEALQALRALLADGGVVVVADEKVADTFTAPGDEIERLNFGFSWWHCLPASRAETRRRPPGRPCARPRSAAGPGRPGSPGCGSCPSSTCSGGSTSCAAERSAGWDEPVEQRLGARTTRSRSWVMAKSKRRSASGPSSPQSLATRGGGEVGPDHDDSPLPPQGVAGAS